MKHLISYVTWPALMAAAIAINAYGMSTGMPLFWLNVSYFGLAVALFLLERAMPHETRWNQNDGQLWPDIGHTLLSKSAVQVLVIVPALTGIGALASDQGAAWWPREWPVAMQIGLGLFIAEFGFYWAHRLCHEVRPLWRFHAVHHSVTRLWFVNTGRFHFIDTMVSVAFGLGIALAFGMPQDIIVWVSVITAYIGLLTHTNAQMRTGPLDYVFNTPALHRWHHSRVPEEGNRNYGENLMIFDLAFGTHFITRRRPPVDIGINEPMPATLAAQIAHPFKRESGQPHAV